MMFKSSNAIAIGALVATLFAHPAPAQNASAEAHFEKGQQLFAEARYPAALAEFRKSFEIEPKPAVLYRIAHCQKAVSDYVGSIASFQEYLAQGGKSVTPNARKKIAGLVAGMQKDLGTISVSASEKKVSVSVDGNDAGFTPLAGPIHVSPGPHTVLGVAKDGRLGRESVTVMAGEEVKVNLDKVLPKPAPLPSPVAVKPAPRPLVKPPAAPRYADQVTWVMSGPAGLRFTRSEITVAQYRACVRAGKCRAPYPGRSCNWDRDDRGNHPVNCVDLVQAEAVCRWFGGRLPTAEEWYAEASDAGDRRWPWGDKPEVSCDLAIWGDAYKTDGCGKEATWPACSKPRGNSVSGLCDMSGNVWEWTSTKFKKTLMVVRGGSWVNDSPDYLRAAGRYRAVPIAGGSNLGVRCVR